jgi:hypothetical protein
MRSFVGRLAICVTQVSCQCRSDGSDVALGLCGAGDCKAAVPIVFDPLVATLPKSIATLMKKRDKIFARCRVIKIFVGVSSLMETQEPLDIAGNC